MDLRTTMTALVVAGLAATAWVGCESSGGEDGGEAKEAPAKEKKRKKKKKADDGDEAQPSSAKADAPAAVSGDAPAQPAKATGGRSAVPSLDEWNAVTKEVVVKGSSALNCETKMVREWLRVSCRGKNDTGGEPTGVSVMSGGGRGDDFVFTGDGVASLVVRFVEGVDLKAQFTWTDKTKVLRVWWPRGAPEPPPKGEFM